MTQVANIFLKGPFSDLSVQIRSGFDSEMETALFAGVGIFFAVFTVRYSWLISCASVITSLILF